MSFVRSKAWFKKNPPKATKRRKTRKRATMKLGQGVPSGISNIQVAKLRYSENITLTSAFSVLNFVGYRANGLNDPRAFAGGHRPMAMDTWASLYNYYVVKSAKVTFHVTDGNEQIDPYICGAYLDDNNSTLYTDSSGYIEGKKGSYRFSTGKQSSPLAVKTSFNAKKFFNVTDIKDNLPTLGSVVADDPTNQAYFMFWYQVLNGGSGTVSITVVVDYVAEFSEPKTLSQS